MRRVFGFLFVLAGASCAAAAGSPAASMVKPAPKASAQHVTIEVKHTTVRLAPADEYFGPLKMSILGIRNEIRDLGLRYTYNHDIAKQIVGMAAMTEKAVLDWQQRYPDDTMLARHVYLLEHLYAQIDDPNAQAKADLTAKWLLKRYAKSWYAKNLRVTMARDAATRKSMAAATPEPSQPDHETTPGGAVVATPVPVLNLLPSPSAGSGLSIPSATPSSAPAVVPNLPQPSAGASPAPSGASSPGSPPVPASSSPGSADESSSAAPVPTSAPDKKRR